MHRNQRRLSVKPKKFRAFLLRLGKPSPIRCARSVLPCGVRHQCYRHHRWALCREVGQIAARDMARRPTDIVEVGETFVLESFKGKRELRRLARRLAEGPRNGGFEAVLGLLIGADNILVSGAWRYLCVRNPGPCSGAVRWRGPGSRKPPTGVSATGGRPQAASRSARGILPVEPSEASAATSALR